jgi:hypothetical protein
MSARSTYALDPSTVARSKRLAAAWGVSQAEVIRRAVQRAAEQADEAVLSPADVVAYYASRPPSRSAEETRALAESLRELRHQDNERRGRAS